LALATSLSALLNATLLYFGLLRREIYVHEAGGGRFLIKVIVSAVCMGVLLWFMAPQAQVWFEAALAKRVMMLSGLVALGGGCYLLGLLVMGIRPRHFVKQ
jgi:putative peptidoglycan lipid II flippase